jgi:hypothetical protein
MPEPRAADDGMPPAVPDPEMVAAEPVLPAVLPVVPLLAPGAVSAPAPLAPHDSAPAQHSPAPLTPRESAPAPGSLFAGTWVYVPPRLAPREREHELYPPEYVETVIQQAGEAVRGRYRARYRVADRPISPIVAFQFEGSARHSPATLVWHGPDGASGEVRLTLLPSGNLRVDWLATSLGGQLDLASGTAVLTRRQDP